MLGREKVDLRYAAAVHSLTRQSRWSGRTAFLATTLLAISALGGPFLVTRGLIEHGALFLPAVLVLFGLIGAPVVRLALASGQLDHNLSGREAMQPLSLLVRLALVAALFGVGTRAVCWILTFSFYSAPDLAYQQREVTEAAASWSSNLLHLPALAYAALVLVAFILLFLFTARRRQLAGLSWIGSWLLFLLLILFALALLAGFAIPGAGAMVSVVASPRLEALLRFEFWADAAACVLLASGAQAGLLASAGEGLPSRAFIGREARILVASMALVLVLAGLAGLALLCGLCARQGVIPGPQHASPTLLLLEIVPALGRDLFPGWPPEYVPSTRQIALAWQYIVAMCSGFGIAALLGTRRWLPRNRTSPAAVAGYAAAALVVVCMAIDSARDIGLTAAPLFTLLPALLCLLHLTFARRAGAGLRVVSAAYGSARPWLERVNITMAMRVARPALVGAVIVLAATMRQYSFTLAGMAAAFALVWLGSLPRPGRNSMRVAAAGLALLLASPAWAGILPVWVATDEILDQPDPAKRRDRVRWMEARASAREGDDSEGIEAFRLRIAERIERPPEAAGSTEAARLRRDQGRDGLCAALMLAPEDPEFQRLERVLLRLDGVHPVRIDEALSEHAAGRPALLREQCAEIARHLPAPRIRALLGAAPEPATLDWTLALAGDLAAAYGTAPPMTRDFRQYLLRRGLGGRTLLRPDAATGAVLLACLGLAALALAVALALGLAPRRASP